MLILLRKAATWAVLKHRLLIEYALIGVVVTLAGTAVALWMSKERQATRLAQTETRLIVTEDRLTTVEGVNRAHEVTIQDLKELRAKDARAIDGLLFDYKILSDNDQHARTRLQMLESSNEAVHDYLNLRVPAELACVLNNTCAKAADFGADNNRASRTPKRAH